jgi:alpha-L-rhamnosidase
LTSAGARHLTTFGEAAIAWSLEGDALRVQVDVPVGATAVLDLPGAAPEEIGHGRYERTVAVAQSVVNA